MLSTISWSHYFLFLLLSITVYYLFVWVVYFNARLSFPKSAASYGEDQPDEVLNTVQHIINEIRPVIQRHKNREELIMALQLRLKKYQYWDEPGFRDSINLFILNECQGLLDENDQHIIWK